MKRILAKALKPGATIGIIKPSDRITLNRKKLLENGIKKLKSQGFNFYIPENFLSTDKYGVSGGDAKERAKEINKMFADPNIDAIWCAHGGDTIIEIIDLIDYDLIAKNPKLFLGMSDIDVLHIIISEKTGLITFNSCDLKSGKGYSLDFEYSRKSFEERLMEKKIGFIKPSSSWKCVREGIAEGEIIGCNITSIMKLAGTHFLPDFSGKILFIDGYTTDIRKAIWKFTQMKHMGIFDKVAGVVLGYFSHFQVFENIWNVPNHFDDKNYSFKIYEQRDAQGNIVHIEDIFLDITKKYSFPVLKINEFGHLCPNAFIPIGGKVRIDTINKTIEITEPCVL